MKSVAPCGLGRTLRCAVKYRRLGGEGIRRCCRENKREA